MSSRDALKNDHPTLVDTNNKIVYLKNWTSKEPSLSCLVSIAVNGKLMVMYLRNIIGLIFLQVQKIFTNSSCHMSVYKMVS